jgi:hypothetical protein
MGMPQVLTYDDAGAHAVRMSTKPDADSHVSPDANWRFELTYAPTRDFAVLFLSCFIIKTYVSVAMAIRMLMP